MSTAYIALGSNLGERAVMLRRAICALHDDPAVRVVAESGVYETAPVGGPEQPDYLNMVVAVETNFTPEALLARCLEIEAENGRVRRERWGARALDLDLLWYEGGVRQTETLTLPHPRMVERAFVLVPLAEIAPELRLGNATVGELAAAIDHGGLRRLGALAEGLDGRAQ